MTLPTINVRPVDTDWPAVDLLPRLIAAVRAHARRGAALLVADGPAARA